ncbi:MAG: HAD-IA family hydrolase [Candidatus Micrarchaeota archaeon]|nr:HAD-IA family hydrolase [Candidatus Micrarchaeota archaeon]
MQPLLRDFDLFIFDWDGTLSTSTLVVRLSHFLKRRYNPNYIRAHPEEFRQPKKINGALDAGEAKTLDFVYDIYSFFARPKLREGTIELLEGLRANKKTIALFSDGAQGRLNRELRRLGVEKYFDIIVSAETIRAYKPNPTGVELVIKKTKGTKKKSLYIGDMAIDIFMARFAGVRVCVVGKGLDPYSKLSACKPDYIFESTEALARKIG